MSNNQNYDIEEVKRKSLNINILSQEAYDSIDNPDPTELYFTPDTSLDSSDVLNDNAMGGASPSETKVPSQKSAKTYIDSRLSQLIPDGVETAPVPLGYGFWSIGGLDVSCWTEVDDTEWLTRANHTDLYDLLADILAGTKTHPFIKVLDSTQVDTFLANGKDYEKYPRATLIGMYYILDKANQRFKLPYVLGEKLLLNVSPDVVVEGKNTYNGNYIVSPSGYYSEAFMFGGITVAERKENTSTGEVIEDRYLTFLDMVEHGTVPEGGYDLSYHLKDENNQEIEWTHKYIDETNGYTYYRYNPLLQPNSHQLIPTSIQVVQDDYRSGQTRQATNTLSITFSKTLNNTKCLNNLYLCTTYQDYDEEEQCDHCESESHYPYWSVTSITTTGATFKPCVYDGKYINGVVFREAIKNFITEHSAYIKGGKVPIAYYVRGFTVAPKPSQYTINKRLYIKTSNGTPAS